MNNWPKFPGPDTAQYRSSTVDKCCVNQVSCFGRKPDIVFAGAEHIQQIMDLDGEGFDVSWSYESFKKELDNPNSFVLCACIDDTVVGFVCTRQLDAEAEVFRIAVNKLYRRQGIATSLLQRVFSILSDKEISFTFLEVESTNISAIGLYRKMGFVDDGVRRNYYGYGRDAILMSMSLIDSNFKVA